MQSSKPESWHHEAAHQSVCIVGVLAPMGLSERREAFGRQPLRITAHTGIGLHAFVATGHPQQVSIVLERPLPRDTEPGKGLVKGRQMALSLGLCQGTVHIKEQSTGDTGINVVGHGSLPERLEDKARAIVARQAIMRAHRV